VWSDHGTIVFSSAEPFAAAVRAVRSALRACGLCVIAEMDVARRLTRELAISLPSCRVLYVWPATSASEEVFPAAAVFLPLHVVVVSRGHQTEVHLLGDVKIDDGEIESFVRSAVIATRVDILRCLEDLSMRLSTP